MTRSFETISGQYSPEVQLLAEQARRLLIRLLPGAQETVDPTASVISYGYGPGYRGMVCTLLLSKSGVKIGLVRGAGLSDPDGLLEGQGKKNKYVPVKNVVDLDRPSLHALITAALETSEWRPR